VEERLASSVPIAVVWAGGAAAAFAPESVKALALTGLAVAVTFATALD
jgi:succinate dehydrogenase/fumarate reductase flavoprotein subunit